LSANITRFAVSRQPDDICDRDSISKVRKQSIEADEDQPVEGIEAEPLGRGAPQDNDLLTQGQVLGFE
jgi:hypothetical protein